MPIKPQSLTAKQTKERKQAYDRAYDKQRGGGFSRGYGGKEWEATQRMVTLRDDYRCVTCGCDVCVKPKDYAVDHIVERDQGGSDDPSNLQTLCVRCHGKKTRAEHPKQP
jgi:5-methylcytosine-specific restriction enzyme A